jgi:hypothetical protein
MTALAKEITYAIVSEFGQKNFLEKISDPYWFQALGCVLGFDWHSSGLTTTVTGALKEGMRGMERELRLFLAGGKGTTSRKTPDQIRQFSERFFINPERLIYASKMSAKVDNTAVLDGYQLYHHVFLFTEEGEWAVVQQGMNTERRTARRYHWLSKNMKNFVVDPHAAICCNKRAKTVNMTAVESNETRKICKELACQNPDKIVKEMRDITRLELKASHAIEISDINPKRLHRILTKTYETQPENFEGLLGIEGVGSKTIRALSLISEIIYGAPPSYKDPARFSFAHGGKDGIPFPVDRKTYDKSIEIIEKAIYSAKLGNREKLDAVKRLSRYFEV